MIEPYKLSLLRALPLDAILEVAEEILWEEVLEQFAREDSPRWIRDNRIGALPIEPPFPPAMIAEMQEALRQHEAQQEQQAKEFDGLSSQQLIEMAEKFATQAHIGEYGNASRSSVIRIKNQQNVKPETEMHVRDACIEIITSRGECLDNLHKEVATRRRLKEEAAARKRLQEVATRKRFRPPSSKDT